MELNRDIHWIPRLGMEFRMEEEAWQFWNRYAGRMGFGVRRRYSHKSRVDSVLTSAMFVCINEGQKKDKKNDNVKNPRAETRTDCKVRLGIKFFRKIDNFKVECFVSEHNHRLQKPKCCHFIRSQRKVTEVAQFDIDLADESGIRPKQAYELMSRQTGGCTSLPFTITDHRNYLRDKRKRILASGAAVAMLHYFNERTLENSSFHHVEQVDEFQEITNILWADAKMIADYARFGDVIAFDTTFGTNKEHRPFGVFVGFNHFREIVIFGATLMYDQSEDSFAWVFKTFLETHNHKTPKTIFTDQDIAMGNAIKTVMSETTHGLCCWHIMENATKHLGCYNRDGLNILGEFSACMFEYENEDRFKKAFSDLKEKVCDNRWLPFIYDCKEKWAYCYMKNALSLGMRSTQLSESINGDIKSYLNSDLDIIQVLKKFESVVDDKRDNENKSEYEWSRKQPKIKVNAPILQQAGSIYTPKFFKLFQEEYELTMAAQIEGRVNNEFVVASWGFESTNYSKNCRKVFWDHVNLSVSCECKKYERMGILCWHALKVLDAMNIKILPETYIWKRWTRKAREEIVVDRNGKPVIEDTRLDMTRHNRDLCRRFTKIAAQVAYAEELSTFVDCALETLEQQLQKKIQNLSIVVGVGHEPSPVATFDNQPCLKKELEIDEHNLTLQNHSQVAHYVSYAQLLMENSFALSSTSNFEVISSGQADTTCHQGGMPPNI